MSNSNYCIYIPRVSGFYSKDIVAHVISTHIAKVSYIDCVNIPDSTANYPRMIDYDFSAFVYILEFNETGLAQNALARMNTNGSFEFELDTDESWFLIKHKIDQPYEVAATVALEEILIQNSAQQQAIDRLESLVKKQSQEIHRIQNAIYQIIGHCYDQRTESSEMFGIYNMMMHNKQVIRRWMLDENDDGTEEYEREFLGDFDPENDAEYSSDCQTATKQNQIVVPPVELGKEDAQTGKNSPSSCMDVSADRVKNTAELCGNN
jgi:hypothetical protein